MRLIFVTYNQGKLKEMKAILGDLDIEVVSASEAGVLEDVIEDGQTFAENALIKAKFAAERTNEWAVADDSGLSIKALNGEPGVFSARWAGEGASDEEIIKYSLARISDIPVDSRQAQFETAVALCAPDKREWVFSGFIEGEVTDKPRGAVRSKLPYDVVFIPEGFDITFAEMSDEQKNSLSHRGLAFKKLKDFIRKNGLK
ncbi:MAG: non-canonical purine NTP pyrophosphatase, RdgB/HAM1 family [Candidatus Portnoybacteria bacterium CG02_land_8_20_14_3_00_45_8]|uniref:dITP/XTP pyrophosphatase n=1 Tax=Candidatus Portnoybacteria bacterium CG02_land_8_20_14_3_00_45_8 TaxID=1974807 RepID=A0A2M7D5P9_9BACT|nr:MAG: non-canonical purine NTP pyrophosphatase, RdgB/HAM1 family [Candidatus Portnoybacteria bacterium CG02_land_8_20_14_3_00_45_8]